MKLIKLELKNFRSHKHLIIDFEGESLVIKGPNGSGKSNILEAIHMLSTTKSMRAKYDKEVIHYAADTTNIIGDIEKDNEQINLQLAIQKNPQFQNMSKKLAKIDKTKKSLSTLSGQLNTVLFTPESIDLVIGSPSLRRKYLDTIFFQIDKDYKKAHSEYTKVIRQRNKLLDKIREENVGREQLPFWDEKMLKTGTLIQDKREEFINFLTENIKRFATKLTEEKNTYTAQYNKKAISQKKIDEYRNREIAARSTLMGPHRDDIEFGFNGYSLANFGSRGQQRILILILKLCEIEFIEKKVGTRPVLLLDDIYSELDQLHQDAIKTIIPLQQTILTTIGNGTENLKFEKISL